MNIPVNVVEVNHFFDASTGQRNSRVVLESAAKGPTAAGEKPVARVEMLVTGVDAVAEMERVKVYSLTLATEVAATPVVAPVAAPVAHEDNAQPAPEAHPAKAKAHKAKAKHVDGDNEAVVV